jgi:hypothetical protein
VSTTTIPDRTDTSAAAIGVPETLLTRARQALLPLPAETVAAAGRMAATLDARRST